MVYLQVEVVTPGGQVFAGPATSVQATGADGSFEVLANHAHMVCLLGVGALRITSPDRAVHAFNLTGGVLEVGQNRLVVAAENAVADAMAA